MVLCIGEILVDLIGKESDGGYIYKRFAGGAPFNVCCAINKFGKNASFVGSVGDDIMGKFLKEFAQKHTFSQNIKTFNEVNTTLAFVNIDKNGERSFNFFRNHTADSLINFHDIPEELLLNCNIIHIGSLLLSSEKGINLINQLTDYKNNNNKLLSFDVNYRDDIFKFNPKQLYWDVINRCDIVKLSEDELFLLTDNKDISNALSHFKNLVTLVTLGEKGSIVYYDNKIIYKESVKINPVDTTGAGDAFLGGFLSKFDKNKINKENLENLLLFSNICGALTATKEGAIDALPSLNDVLNFKF